MLSRARYTNKENVTLGPARVFLELETGERIEFARVAEDGANLSWDVTTIQMTERHGEGVEVPIEEFKTAENASLTIKFIEQLTPDLFQAIFGIAPEIEAPTIEQVKEILRFNGADPREVGRPYGITDSVVPPTGFTGTKFGSGSISEGEHYIFLEAVFRGGGRSIIVGLTGNKVDITSAQEKIALEWAHPKVAGQDVVPDYYRIYENSENQPLTSVLWVQIPGAATSTVLSTDPDTGAATYPGVPAGVSVLEEFDTGDDMVPNTDYVFDASKGLVQAVDGGGIVSNKAYRFTYYILAPARLVFPAGDISTTPFYRKIIVQQLTELGGKEKGVVWEFEKVNTRGEGYSEAIATTDFSAGIDVTMKPMYDLVTQRVARKLVGGAMVEDWDQAVDA